MGTYPPFPPYVGVPAGVIHMDSTAFSNAVGNSAIVFTPMGLTAPDAYSLTVY
jgi:hypothetical protein